MSDPAIRVVCWGKSAGNGKIELCMSIGPLPEQFAVILGAAMGELAVRLMTEAAAEVDSPPASNHVH